MKLNTRDVGIRRVKELKDPDANEWNLNLLKNIFTNDSILAIIKIRWPSISEEDKLLWKGKNSGAFLVKSSYSINFLDEKEDDRTWAKLWEMKIHKRLKMFIWRIKAGVLPTKDRMAARFVGMDIRCMLCDASVESCFHIFKECAFVQALAFASK